MPSLDTQEKLIADWIPHVRTWASRQKKDPDGAESAGMDTLRRCAINWNGSGGEVGFRGYLNRCLRHTKIDVFRRGKRHEHVEFPESGGISADTCRENDFDVVRCQDGVLTRRRPRLFRRRFCGGPSVVERQAIVNEATAALKRVDKWEAMRVLGYPAEEIEAERQREKWRQAKREQRNSFRDVNDLVPLSEAS